MSDTHEIICTKCHATFLSDFSACPFCGKPVDESQENEPVQNDSQQQENQTDRDSIRSRKELQQKKKKRIMIGVCMILFIGFVIWMAVHQSRLDTEKRNREAYLSQRRNMDTDTLELEFNNVYADIVSVTPSYEVYRKDGSLSVMTSGYLCECKTVKGNTVWVYAPRSDIRYNVNPFGKGTNRPGVQTYPADDPLRLTGSVTNVGNIADKIPAGIDKDMLVLKVDKYPIAYNDRPERKEYLGKRRNMETDKMEEGFTNVYVDIVSITPAVSISNRQYPALLTGIVCKCETVNGKTVWAYCSVGGGSELYVAKNCPPRQYPSDHPRRLQGSIVSAYDLAWDLSSKIGYATYILEIEKYPDAYSDDGTPEITFTPDFLQETPDSVPGVDV